MRAPFFLFAPDQPLKPVRRHVWLALAQAFVGFVLAGFFALIIHAVIAERWPSALGWRVVGALALCAGLWGWLAYRAETKATRAWERSVDMDVLSRRSVALMAWAVRQTNGSLFSKHEPSTWAVLWVTSPFGMRAKEMWVLNPGQRIVGKWDFEVLPEGVRLAEWPNGPTDSFDRGEIRVRMSAYAPPLTGHARLDLEARSAQALA